MQQPTKILVPIDFSACSENALEFAIQLAHKIKANIQVLNVSSYNTGLSEHPSLVVREVEDEIKHARNLVRATVKKITESIQITKDENLKIETKAEIGKVRLKICDVAASNQIDYIVMGTQGVNSTADRYLGSTTVNVLEAAPCSVLVIPENATFQDTITLGYASDFMDADTFGIWKAVKFLQPFQPKIKYVHFNEKEASSANKMEELKAYYLETAPELDIQFFSLPTKDKVGDMNNFIRKSKVNMLAMYKPKRSFFDSLFHNSFTRKMTSYIKIPMLILKEKA